ncbi:hypothetical protein ACFFOS_23905 [Nocardioides kongjuensis]|uniref:Uncharacterized protein n=1 Tax=Nocardioides kongjuensis TaxID=349522 RepID=A0A852RBL0_9ACTN|nr:hypothetical protein [Nocardioides kongjuensis]NYD30981.1 hypothetical protein [Nocardioides kongjuensis]
MQEAPSLADVIGPMLGADFLYADGLILEITDEHPRGLEHRFWAYRTMWRVERSDGVKFIDSSDGSVTTVNGRVRERGPRHASGLHLPERMLRPRYADIWGRSSDDWKLTGEVESSTDSPGLVGLGIARIGESGIRGQVLVERVSGRIVRMDRPGAVWELVDLNEESDGDPAGLFSI